MEGKRARDEGSEREILDGTRDGIDRLGLRGEYPRAIYWAESGVGGIRVWKNELWLPIELQEKLDNWMWNGLVTSALSWRELSKRKLVLIRQFLPILVLEAGLFIAIWHIHGMRS